MQLHTWERHLLSLAHEPLHNEAFEPSTRKTSVDEGELERAYQHCETLTAQHSKSFYLASSLLPLEKRRAARALYAFCRVSDDIVDNSDEDFAQVALIDWRRRTSVSRPNFDDLIALAWLDAKTRFNIPDRYAEQLISGVARDFHQTRYQTFEELTTYAYGVASTVGLMSMHIIGFAGSEAIPYAIKLGVALQITNILRDVGEDWQAGRVYLPLAELEAYDLTEADITQGRVDERWRAFMKFQIERNRRLYAEAWPGIALLDRDGRLAIAAATRLYEAILADIEAHDYDVFNRRAFVGKWKKISMLPKIWWQSKKVTI